MSGRIVSTFLGALTLKHLTTMTFRSLSRPGEAVETIRQCSYTYMGLFREMSRARA